MSFRRRITLVSAAAVTIAVVLASALIYLLTSNQLHGQVDRQLRGRSDNLYLVERAPARGHGRRLLDALENKRPAARQLLEGASQPGNALGNVSPRPNQVRGYQQLIGPQGEVLFRSGAANVTLPVDARTRALAAGKGKSFFRDAQVQGVELRILAEAIAPGRAVQFAQPLTEVNELLAHLRLILVLIGLGGIALAALLGRLVAGAAVRPLRRLTRATEHVALTRDLSSRRIAPGAEDEIGRLARSFNAMLDALEQSMSALDASVHAQRQLVADASHELRTPVTSLRTNIEILQQAQAMEPAERQRLLGDVVEQIEELTLLMNDLIDLARGEEPHASAEEMRLDHVIDEVVEGARRHAPATPLQAELEPTIIAGVPARLERAVSNLIDNAVKYSPPGQPVEIRLHAGELTVRDHGPGIPLEDLPHVFDRFYRGAEARGRPGSGLGLAIVRQVADQHGASVAAERAPGGGTLMRLRLRGAEVLEGGETELQDAGARYSAV
jgi:two-component system, OmpR family, sensor histidine kinase MprB